MIEPSTLQSLLREFGGPLSTAEVKQHILAPQLVTISWVCQLHGRPFFGEANHLDIRDFNDTQDVIRLAGQILKSLEKAEKEAPRH